MNRSFRLSQNSKIRTAIIGSGSLGRNRIVQILSELKNTEIPVICEPSFEAYTKAKEIFKSKDLPIPPNEPDLDRLTHEYKHELDAAYIATPHSFHYIQAKKCLEAGLDVLLEKPMVKTLEEAELLMETRDLTKGLLVVAFQGSLSPHIKTASSILRSGKLGDIHNISATVWQNWVSLAEGTWRLDPEKSGGGFLFDTGAHVLNTVADLAGEDFFEVSAFFNNMDQSVEVNAVIIARLESGTLVTINACGDTAPTCASDIRVFCTNGALRTGAWGESLEILKNQPSNWQLTGISRDQTWKQVEVPESRGVWDEFLKIREGITSNSSPPELGLRMIKLWDAITLSASQNGKPVRISR